MSWTAIGDFGISIDQLFMVICLFLSFRFREDPFRSEGDFRPGFCPYPRSEQFIRDLVEPVLIVHIEAGYPWIDIGFPPAEVEHLS